ncbi:MAG: hypothetical protein IH616_18440 [Gemmatimonadales bacterium]|nr:hypothetical protein [Gemmatimonadales bacterium]
MHTSRWRAAVLAGIAIPLASLALVAQEPAAEPAAFGTPEVLVTELYDLVTFPADTTPDWDRVRALFLDEAVIVLRTTRTATTVFTVEGFVADFVQFIERANVAQTGFSEKILRMKPWVFKDMAHALVLYEASIPGSGRPAQQGIDSFLLIRKDGRWWIAAITNDIPDPNNPVPPELAN